MSKYQINNMLGLSCNPSGESTEQTDLRLEKKTINGKPVVMRPNSRTVLNMKSKGIAEKRALTHIVG